MILDIIFIAIVVVCAVFGFRKGFGYTFIQTAGWIISLIAAFITTPYVKNFLLDKTNIEEDVIAAIPVQIELPEILGKHIMAATEDAIFTIIVFVAIFIIIEVIIWLLLRLFTRSNEKSFINVADGIFGAVFGAVKGVILVLVIILALLPLVDVFIPNFAEGLQSAIESSYITNYLYDQNPILLLLQGNF